MEKYFEILKKTMLFSGIEPGNLNNMLTCLKAKAMSYRKGEIILSAGEKIKHIGIVLEGKVFICRDDISGNRNIHAKLESGDKFGEVFALTGIPCAVYAEAQENTEILYIEIKNMNTSCGKCEVCNTDRLKQNLLTVIAFKNIALQEKVNCIGHRNMREKVSEFLTIQKLKAGKNTFTIALSREEMADYLCVDRSALSAVLSKLREEGVIEYHKNTFKIL